MDDLTHQSQIALESITAKRKFHENEFDQENDEVNGQAEKKVTEFRVFLFFLKIFPEEKVGGAEVRGVQFQMFQRRRDENTRDYQPRGEEEAESLLQLFL